VAGGACVESPGGARGGMRAVVQRVARASVTVSGDVVAAIGPGLVCLVGIAREDDGDDVDYVCKKILKTRMFPQAEDEGGQRRREWDLNVVQRGLEILLVSQFTLQSDLGRKGTRPDFSGAMPPDQARDVYNGLVSAVSQAHGEPDKVRSGTFGATMDVELVNRGPVTFIVDSSRRRKATKMRATAVRGCGTRRSGALGNTWKRRMPCLM